MFKTGMSILDFNCNTIDGKKSIKNLMTKEKNILIFSRFYGCRITQYELKDFSNSYSKINEQEYEVIFVVQSSEKIIRKAFSEQNYPFTIICDPEAKIYDYFAVGLAKNQEILSEGTVITKVKKADEMGLKKGEKEGRELQLPAQFVIDKNLKVLFSYYGKNAGDILDPVSILEVMKKL